DCHRGDPSSSRAGQAAHHRPDGQSHVVGQAALPGRRRKRLYFQAGRHRQAALTVPGMVATLKDPDSMAVFDIELRLLLEAIFLRYQHDFRSYTVSSLRRRLGRALVDLKVENLSRLQERVLREPALLARLMQYLTVQVSDMFRDPSYFKALRETVIPMLKTYPSVKVWVAGCSAGEELWSLAILF